MQTTRVGQTRNGRGAREGAARAGSSITHSVLRAEGCRSATFAAAHTASH